MTDTTKPGTEVGGLRARKRRETLQRITQSAVRLFIANGYEATTLDAIAAAAGISRRTFFYYFKSKDDILLFMESGIGDSLAAALRDEPPGGRPLDVVRRAMLRSCALYAPAEMIVIDRLMRSSEAVQARKQASYVRHEQTVLAALRERWPAPGRETALRMVAMLAIGALRLALDAWSQADGARPVEDFLNDAFDSVASEMQGTAPDHLASAESQDVI